MNDRLGMGLFFVHHSQDFRDLDVECRLRAEEDIAVGLNFRKFSFLQG